jgi:uncharacterized protein with PhoU and TrkA domain
VDPEQEDLLVKVVHAVEDLEGAGRVVVVQEVDGLAEKVANAPNDLADLNSGSLEPRVTSGSLMPRVTSGSLEPRVT